ncbi:uncharacterized protein Nmag_2617 [Natrialba magadii ATCC 43099]|uniref:Uncharacterized protein n=1 Tax=Natrialba magadii (strain ATCC 43099 / DSM 3394 / CCM 3739 / CIP 104546 / IAM 13178 / JCM 8861 / NBRC 102185 / NCIMB 2190 / MS3) TaxID=547559 RepID=D3SYY4_NATMM|nr:hypothetical protein [Natrialba magadii]ADD06176.1 uncharacterized protein Nmag_2617 [Natrialba magadii ATCC 43099]ELY30825.1 hypothetical protein C500_07303 [Natrialba magadii ATCC 43099]
MNVPTDRLLIMIIVATGFAIVGGGWAAALVQAEMSGFEEIALRVGIGVVFFAILIGFWYVFTQIDRDHDPERESA